MKKKYIKPEIEKFGDVTDITKAAGPACPKDHPLNAGSRVC